MAILYEVTLEINADIAARYDAWLTQHVAEMLTLPGFLDADIWVADDDSTQPKQVVRVVHYYLEDRAALDAYYRHHAARMRDEGITRFGEQFRATRRILRPVS